MVDVRGFVTPEQNFGGLYKVSQNLRQEDAQREADAKRAEAGKAASSKFLVDYLDQDQFLTGTPQDPYTVKKVSDLLQEGSALIERGVDNNQLLMALSPKVGRLSQETQTLKQINEQKKKAGEMLKANPAIDLQKLNNAFDEIYFETDEMGGRRLKDISKLDPSKDYVTEILNTKPIYTPAGFDAYVGKAGTVAERQSMTVKDSKGGLSKKDMELQAPEFMVPEINAKGEFTRQFVPKHEVAMNEAKPILTKFMDEEGREVDAEIRLLDKNTFANLPKEALAYVMQEARQFSDENGIPVNDPRTEMFARALAYDSLKNSAKQKTSAKEIVVQQAQPAPKFTTNNYINTKEDDTPVIDLWTDFKTTVDNAFAKGQAVPAKNIPNSQYKIIKNILIERGMNKDLLALNDWAIQPSTDGGALVVYGKDKKPMGTFTPDDFDIAANKELGVKSKTKAVQGRSTTNTPKTQPASGKVKVKIDGKIYEVDASALPAMDKDGVKYQKM